MLLRLVDKVASRFARVLPKRVKFYCGVYILAHSTSGKYSKTIVPQLSGLEALDRFYQDLLK